MSARQWAALAPALAITAAGSFAAVWILADWIAGAALLAHHRRAQSSGEWVWR